MKKFGFTLIELLAVIVILTIIALIATPIIFNIIESSRKESFKNSSLNVFKSAELFEAKNNFDKLSSDGVSITDELIPLEYGNFTSGKIIRNESNEIELINITNGTYCAKGTKSNLVVIKGTCDQFDVTAPTNTNITIDKITSSSFRVIVSSEDLESGIKNYQYSIDGNNYVTTTSNNYIFSSLNINQLYTVYVRVINNNNIKSEIIEKQVTTSNIDSPTYSVDKTGWQVQKVVTITYPTRQTEFVYEYSINAGSTWTTVASGTTQTVTFNANGSVIARIYDGTNYKTASSYTVSQIDANNPIITAKGASYTITQGASNDITSTYFNINENGGATISSTQCINASNGNVAVINTSSLAPGTHTIRCTVTKTTGTSAYSTTSIVVMSNGSQFSTVCAQSADSYAIIRGNEAAYSAGSSCEAYGYENCGVAAYNAYHSAYAIAYKSTFTSCCYTNCSSSEICMSGCVSDTTSPTVSFSAYSNIQTYKNTLSTWLTIVANDNYFSQEELMMYISNNGHGIGGVWEAYSSASKSWSVGGTYDGVNRTIYVQVKDPAGNITNKTATYYVPTSTEVTYGGYYSTCSTNATNNATSCGMGGGGATCSEVYQNTLTTCCSNYCAGNSTCLNICK